MITVTVMAVFFVCSYMYLSMTARTAPLPAIISRKSSSISDTIFIKIRKEDGLIRKNRFQLIL